MDIHVAIEGDHEVGIRFEEFPDQLYNDLRQAIEALTEELFAAVEAATPSKTGRLRSEERMRVKADPNKIVGSVTIAGDARDFAKAGALEYGAHRLTKVSAHSMRLDHAWDRRFASPERVMVAAYTRTPDVQAVAFERGPLDAMAPQIIAELTSVVEKRVAETNG